MNLNIVECFVNKHYYNQKMYKINKKFKHPQILNILELTSKTKLLYLAKSKNTYKIIDNITKCFTQKSNKYFNEYIYIVLRQATIYDNVDLVYYIYNYFIIDYKHTLELTSISKKNNALQILNFLLYIQKMEQIYVNIANPYIFKSIGALNLNNYFLSINYKKVEDNINSEIYPLNDSTICHNINNAQDTDNDIYYPPINSTAYYYVNNTQNVFNEKEYLLKKNKLNCCIIV